MSELKTKRWKQRFENLVNAYEFLHKASQKEELSDLEASGLIKAYEMTFELCCKTLKDYLEAKGSDVKFPRDVLKEAFQAQLIEDGHSWVEMLDK